MVYILEHPLHKVTTNTDKCWSFTENPYTLLKGYLQMMIWVDDIFVTWNIFEGQNGRMGDNE